MSPRISGDRPYVQSAPAAGRLDGPIIAAMTATANHLRARDLDGVYHGLERLDSMGLTLILAAELPGGGDR